MAQPPLLQLSNICFGLGEIRLFDGLDLVLRAGDRLALVGRNGSGKSTLMKVMAGSVEPDEGSRTLTAGQSVGYMEQDPDLSGFTTLGDFATASLGPGQDYLVERAATGLGLSLEAESATASGGERRRAALARILAEAPDLMLLDEPTNHLDIDAILWLETHLRQTRAAFVTISHDRTFLRNLTRGTLWLDRAELRRQDKGFETFEEWRDKLWAEEDLNRHKLNRKIKAEARWAVEGISARRKRNQGRLRALEGLRKERASQIRRQGTAALTLEAAPQSGKRVVEVDRISKSYGNKQIIKDFTLQVARGDRVAIVGGNGTGKTTLIRLLTGEEEPDSGTIKRGTNLAMAMLDQKRANLIEGASLWENLTGDPEMRVSGKADQVMVRGTPRHVVGYLKDFLFDETQAHSPVSSLSGGERARLLLARIMARECNLLVLDEPTNDLDIETLDLLQEVIGDFPGTVLIVSHDRDFIDRVATTTIHMEGAGRATIYAGGWSDMEGQRQPDQRSAPLNTGSGKAPKAEKAKPAKATAPKGLSFTQKHRLEALPAEIERLEAEIAKLSEFLADPNLFSDAPAKFAKASEALTERQAALSAAEEEWLTLEELASEAG